MISSTVSAPKQRATSAGHLLQVARARRPMPSVEHRIDGLGLGDRRFDGGEFARRDDVGRESQLIGIGRSDRPAVSARYMPMWWGMRAKA